MMKPEEMLERMANLPEWNNQTTREQVIQAALRELVEMHQFMSPSQILPTSKTYQSQLNRIGGAILAITELEL